MPKLPRGVVKALLGLGGGAVGIAETLGLESLGQKKLKEQEEANELHRLLEANPDLLEVEPSPYDEEVLPDEDLPY